MGFSDQCYLALFYLTIPIWFIPVYGMIYGKKAWDACVSKRKRREGERLQKLEDTDARGAE